MHLKSLTLKGFKSFASSTTLNFEPGVTAVVGPNGSGKSNVVDALAWVMGEQGAKSLRGGKMDDVIFAGTVNRPALGRAEVRLTIDNTDGALPIDYTEVTISRIMFRSGGSEYAINGSNCRLLDVQELLSDSGIGREMHVIVGQGQLDSILHATPEDRRGFIEEAAGVLKHRRRKEKALRKLDGLTDKLDRLQDLSGELRRQLKPLGRQAEVARRAAVIQADLRDSRLRLLADDFVTASASLDKGAADEEALRHRRSEQEAALLAQRAAEAQEQSLAEEQAPQLATAEDLDKRLTAVTERLRGIAAVAAERLSMLDRVPSPAPGRDPRVLKQQAEQAQRQHAVLSAEAEQHKSAVAAVVAARQAVDAELTQARQDAGRVRTAIERAVAAAGQAARRDSASAAAVSARQAELQRAGEARTTAQQALAEVRAEEQATVPSTDLSDLQSEFDSAQKRRAEAAAAVTQRRAAVSAAQRHQAGETARAEALLASAAALDANSGAATLSKKLPGVLGTVAEAITVDEPARRAVVSALGALADGLAVSDSATAAAAVTMLSSGGSERAELVVALDVEGPARAAPPVGQALSAAVISGGPVSAAVREILRPFALVADVDEAQSLVSTDATWTAVTAGGDVLGSTWARGGVRDGSTKWDLRDAADRARVASEDAGEQVQLAQTALNEAMAAEKSAAAQAETARSRWQDERTSRAASDERAAQWRRRLAAAERGAETAAGRVASLQAQLERDRAEQEAAAAALAVAESARAGLTEPDQGRETELIARLGELRQSETDARLALAAIEERAATYGRQATTLTREAAAQEQAAAREETRRQRAAQATAVATRVAELAELAGERALADLAEVSTRRLELREAMSVRQSRLQELRGAIRDLEADIARLTDSVHQDEVALAEQRLRVEQIAEKALSEHGIDTTVLVAEYGPEVLVPPSPVAPGDAEDGPAVDAQPYPYERKAQERRLRTAERSLTLLGAVNPLALEEFAAMEERHTYLNEQIEDIKRTKADLLGIIKDVDARVEQVFAEAFADTAVQFERVFERLFPGGEGRLILTDPKDLLATGVDVEARPPGKKVKRLSLLSGGERSLTAVAFLIALFKARPSPFYVLDEVEAALDDTNLGRLIDVIEELRTNSQLIVITHQRRTMEAADALYGVSMRGDGVTTVVSQRLPRPSPVVDLTDGAGQAP